ncbi:MAG: 50S ribosomal protein L33 [Alphaproteobacteria bacterium CG_4_10_14_0_8_um_filter_53_9]|nr:MAG: 50S ribosomal protein L33 [Alphaproteobacteria bacterium CG_4_10_14_0_8_um_filter_53_9]
MAKGSGSIYIKMVSTAINPKTGKKTGYFYVTKKNPKSLNTTEKLVMRKYDPVVRQHVEFKEEKMK